MDKNNTTWQELQLIDSLLRDESFTIEMAMALDAAYYLQQGKMAPPFIAPGGNGFQVEGKDDETGVAINLAAFFALECGLDYLCAMSGETPLAWLQKIVDKNLPIPTSELLARFANATWKAGQPFRGLDRIQKSNFTLFSNLSADAIEKDHQQIENAAALLKTELQPGTLPEQMQQLRALLRDTAFARKMAAWMCDSFNNSGEKKQPYESPGNPGILNMKSLKDEKIAASIAGFYGLECGLNWLIVNYEKSVVSILKEIVEESISAGDRNVLNRFANATWKAGQPFRGLDRITRDTFTPYYFLTEADIAKDWGQVKTAAGKLLNRLQQ